MAMTSGLLCIAFNPASLQKYRDERDKEVQAQQKESGRALDMSNPENAGMNVLPFLQIQGSVRIGDTVLTIKQEGDDYVFVCSMPDLYPYAEGKFVFANGEGQHFASVMKNEISATLRIAERGKTGSGEPNQGLEFRTNNLLMRALGKGRLMLDKAELERMLKKLLLEYPADRDLSYELPLVCSDGSTYTPKIWFHKLPNPVLTAAGN